MRRIFSRYLLGQSVRQIAADLTADGFKTVQGGDVLPIMGGGNGAGAVPLSNIYENVTGEPAVEPHKKNSLSLSAASMSASRR